MRLGILLSAAFAAAVPASAQKFEVASIKACRPGDAPVGGGRGAGGLAGGNDPVRLRLECQTVDRLIRMAYIRFASGQPRRDGTPPVSPRIMNQQIDGSPAWIASQQYTIDAKPESPQAMEMMRGPMLQALLEDRFRLKLHRESREVPIYALVVAKGGPKLAPTEKGSCTTLDFSNGAPPFPGPGQPPPCGSFSDAKGGLATFGQTIMGLAMQFTAALDRDVVDRTGIAGAFDIHLELTGDELFPWESKPAGDAAPPAPADPLSAIERALAKLGLRIEPAKASAEFLVIDRVERPSEN